MTTTPQQRGRDFEREVGELVGADPVPGSGNRLYKLDSRGQSLLWSAKWTGNESIRVDGPMLEELRAATTGAGGVGESVTPILVAGIEGIGRVVAVLDLMDLIALLKGEGGMIPATKDDQRRATASVPGLLRDDGTLD